MKATFVLAGALLAVTGYGQGYVRVGNTATTPVYTNDCAGTLGLISGNNTYRFGIYVASGQGQPAGALGLIGIVPNNAAILGRFGDQNPITLPAPYSAGDTITFQVRGWSSFAGASFQDAVNAAATNPSVYLGVSALGYVTPGNNTLTAPSFFGTNAGQVGGFELQAGSCRQLAFRRIAPDGPVAITRFTRDGVLTWTNMFASNALYKFRVASQVTGNYGNYTVVTASTASVTFTNPYSGGPQLFPAIEWADAPLPQPVGTWDYQAFDPRGAVMAVGVITFTSNVPCTVSRNFSRIETSQQYSPVVLHPAGAGTLDAYSAGRSNLIALSYPGFGIRGQMVLDYFAGDWFAVDYIINPQPGGPFAITHGGRFVARRR